MIATVDSARRLGLIAPLDPAASREALTGQTQWAVTDNGRRTIRHGLPWVFDKLGGLTKMSSILTLVVGAISLGAILHWLHERNGAEVALGAELVIFLVWGICSLALALRSRSAGARARRTASQDWRRWQQDRPEWSEIATRGFPLWPTLAAVLLLGPKEGQAGGNR